MDHEFKRDTLEEKYELLKYGLLHGVLFQDILDELKEAGVDNQSIKKLLDRAGKRGREKMRAPRRGFFVLFELLKEPFHRPSRPDYRIITFPEWEEEITNQGTTDTEKQDEE